MSLPLLLLALFGLGADRLGHPDWRTRDAHETRLGAAGVLALPAVWLGLTHPDPEVQERASRLAPDAMTLAARAALTAPDGWVTPAEAEWWGLHGRWRWLMAEAGRLGLVPPGASWPHLGREADAVRAWCNYCRSQRREPHIPWQASWNACLDPESAPKQWRNGIP